MNCRRPVWIIYLLCLLAGCSKPTKAPYVPPVDSVNIIDGWPSWSPDGRYIYFNHEARDTLELLRYGQFSVWAYDTQIHHYSFLVGPGMFAKANPQGTILAFNWGQTLFFYYFDSQKVRQVSDQGEIYTFDWTPDGSRLIFGGTYRGNSGCLLIDTLGNFIKDMLPQGWQGSTDACWIGDRILVGAGIRDSIAGALILIDTVGDLIDQLYTEENEGGFSYPSWSPDQTKFLLNISYTQGNRSYSDFRLFSIDGALINILSPDAGMGQWFPDGTKIIFQKYTFMGHSLYPDLFPDYGRVPPWICNADGSDMHELLGWPQLAPDSTMFDGGYNWVTDTYAP